MDASLPENTLRKVFISYSWTSQEHQDWVEDLAKKLTDDGIHVLLDIWDLAEGQDKYDFMEKSVKDPDVTRVLLICDRAYKEKADGRRGGVGTESQIISKEVYDSVEQRKFLPVVRERDENGDPCLPVFLASRIYFDFSRDEGTEAEFEKLIRNIYERPERKRPPLGRAPARIFDQSVRLPTSSRYDRFVQAVMSEKPSARGLAVDFLEMHAECLASNQLSYDELPKEAWDQPIYDRIERMLPLRDSFLDFVDFCMKYVHSEWLIDSLQTYFERILPYRSPAIPAGATFCPEQSDHYRFFLYEVFLYTVGSFAKKRRLDELCDLLCRQFYCRHNSSSDDASLVSYEVFNQYCRALDEARNRRLGLNRVSVVADTIKERATRPNVAFVDLMQADTILFCRSQIQYEHGWHPRTVVFASRVGTFELFARAVGPDVRRSLCSLLQIDSIDELVRFVVSGKAQSRVGQSIPFFDVNLRKLLNIDALQSLGRT